MVGTQGDDACTCHRPEGVYILIPASNPSVSSQKVEVLIQEHRRIWDLMDSPDTDEATANVLNVALELIWTAICNTRSTTAAAFAAKIEFITELTHLYGPRCDGSDYRALLGIAAELKDEARVA